MASKIPTIKFHNGIEYPIIGFGTFNPNFENTYKAVKNAIQCGYRHIDAAQIYMNQNEVGNALQEKIEEGVVKREDLTVTSKLWNTFHRKELVMPVLENTLKELKLAYIDLYLIHWPTAYKEFYDLRPVGSDNKLLFTDTCFTDTWKAMENCIESGLTKAIGLSNFNSKQIQRILEVADIKPVNNQVECHPYFNQSKLIEFCLQRDITVTAYSPLGSPGRQKHPTSKNLLKDPLVLKLSEKYCKSPGQILIRYQIERGVMVIPKSFNTSRIQSNFDVFDFEISPEDMAKLKSLNRPDGRIMSQSKLKNHKDFPFNEEF